MAVEEEKRMIAEGEEEAGDGQRQLEAELEDMRQRESRYLYWSSWCRKGFHSKAKDGPVMQGPEAELVRLNKGQSESPRDN
jgi:hypothetical protein